MACKPSPVVEPAVEDPSAPDLWPLGSLPNENAHCYSASELWEPESCRPIPCKSGGTRQFKNQLTAQRLEVNDAVNLFSNERRRTLLLSSSKSIYSLCDDFHVIDDTQELPLRAGCCHSGLLEPCFFTEFLQK